MRRAVLPDILVQAAENIDERALFKLHLFDALTYRAKGFYREVYGWLTFNVRHGINIPSPMLFTFLIELIPVFMAVYLVSQAPSGKLTAALRQLPLPSSVRLTVIVILRFVPTVASEFSDVLDAMKTRGLLLSPLQVVLHPLNTFEYVVVPMVFRSLKIADELAASSVVRGIESPYKKEGYYLNKMAVSDGVMIALFISTAAMCILV